MPKRRVGCRGFVVAGLVLGGLGSAAVAQELTEQGLQQLTAIFLEKASRTPAQRKLDTSLLYAHRERLGQAMVQGLPPLRRVADRAGVDGDGMVVVDIRAEVTDDLLNAIAGAGGRVMLALPASRAVRARIPIRRIEAIAALSEVRFIGPKQGFLVNAGSATSQGDVAHAAASARTAYGIDGTGVKVGVLSDGVDSLAARQATSDLPATCPQPGACVQVVSGQAGTGDEGTAMMEIIHDLAPGAKLYFATAFNGDASFAANILALKNTYGCDIIVDDITYFNEGAFQDGVIAQAVNTVKAAGVLYLSSAGNSGRLNAGTSGTWEGDFADSGTSINPTCAWPFPANCWEVWQGKALHSFNGLTGASAANSDQLTANAPYAITLKWSDPLGGAVTDYDLFIMDSGLTTVWDLSGLEQPCTPTSDPDTCSDDPYEIAGYGLSGERIVVVRWSGPAKALRLDTNRGRLSLSTARAIVGHNGGDGSISVAAANVSTAGGGAFTGGATNPVETYSSDGPRRIFYNPDGSPITPGNVLFGTSGGRDLQKPDLTAADCVTTTTPGYTSFCGTSAAAPHAAAIAALLLSASPAPTPAAVGAAMASTALDVNPAGWDRDAGAGIVMADRPETVADLAVVMAGPAGVAKGADAVYTITVTHNGLGSAAPVEVADPTPAGLIFVSNAGDCTTPFPCSFDSLTTGETRTITATFNVPSGYAGPSPFTNTATVSSSTSDPISANNSSSVSTMAIGQANLSIGKTGPASVARGTSAAYTITVSNTGPDEAPSVQVTDATPAGLTFVSTTGDCTTAFPCALGTLASGQSRTITATFSLPSGYAGPSPFTNTATVTSAATDPVPANNSSSVQTTVTSQADLTITKTGPASVARGANVVYTIVVTNAGPSDAASIEVSDAAPPGLNFVSNTGDCTMAFPCSLGSIPSGATRTITATFGVPAGYSGPNPFTNTATVTASTADPALANNSSSALTMALAAADLSISKTGPAFATRGANLTYTIVVTNAGPESTASMEVADPTPTGLTFVSNTGDCTSAFPCALGTVPSGESRTITATFSVPAGQDVETPIVNTASVSGPMADPDSGNNSASATSLFGAYYTLTPCRLVDTRLPASQPALQPGQERTFVLAGPPCGIPVGAAALSVNVTIAAPTAPGYLSLYPADVGAPLVSSINFSTAQTRASNAIVPATADGSVAIKVKNGSDGTVQLILDVNGYFE